MTVSRCLHPRTAGWWFGLECAPGGVLGKTWVPKGQSRDVVVKLTAAERADVRVALHVDQGTKREFEFDPDRAELSLDKPVVVGRKPLEERIALDGLRDRSAGKQRPDAGRGPGGGGRHDHHPLSPAPAAGVDIGQLRSRTDCPANEWGWSFDPQASLSRFPCRSRAPVPGEYVVTAHADSGQGGTFEFSASEPMSSPDQPFKAAGVIVSKRITLR